MRPALAAWVMRRLNSGMFVNELAVFVRDERLFRRARDAFRFPGLRVWTIGRSDEPSDGCLVMGTMHQAKGLEFRSVVVMACDDDVLPLQSRIEGVTDETDLEDVHATERQLLYVACTRARDHLLVTGVRPGSEFLGDLKRQPPS